MFGIEWLSEVVAGVSGLAVGVGVLWRKVRVLTKQGYRVYRSIDDARVYIDKARQGGWEQGEIERAGQLLGSAAYEFKAFWTKAGKVL